MVVASQTRSLSEIMQIRQNRIPHQPLKPLGSILREAGLISEAQLQVALRDQSFNSHLRLGEILAARGWLKQETADFFAEQWYKLLRSHRRRQPLGYYLKASGLLDDRQIEAIMQEHRQLGIRFGSVAVLKGLLKQETVDFFLEYLYPQEKSASAFVGKHSPFYAKRRTREKLDREIHWLG